MKLFSFQQMLYVLFCTLIANNACASPYELSLAKEITLLGTGTAMGVTGYLAEHRQKSPTIEQLNTLDKNKIPAIDRNFVHPLNTTISRTSDVLLLGAMATPGIFALKKQHDFMTISVMYAETLLLAGGAMTLAKGSITRFRPYAYEQSTPLNIRTSVDSQRSFFSGHATLASASLLFSATLYSDYYPDSSLKNTVWGAAIGGSLIVAGLRVAGGDHFPTDVLTGFACGSAIGYLVPAWHRKKKSVRLMPYLQNKTIGLLLQTSFP